MVKVGIIDPVKVVRTALLDAASVAGIILTTEVAICDAPAKDSGRRRHARYGRHGRNGRHGRHDVNEGFSACTKLGRLISALPNFFKNRPSRFVEVLTTYSEPLAQNKNQKPPRGNMGRFFITLTPSLDTHSQRPYRHAQITNTRGIYVLLYDIPSSTYGGTSPETLDRMVVCNAHSPCWTSKKKD